MSIAQVKSTCSLLESRIYSIKDDRDASRLKIARVLAQLCSIARAVDPADPASADMLEAVIHSVNSGVDYARRKLRFDHLPSFGHTRDLPLLKGPDTLYRIFPPVVYPLIVMTLNVIFEHMGVKNKPRTQFWCWFFKYIWKCQVPKPWDTTPRPHSSSHVLSRFIQIPAQSPSPIFHTLSEARCEISSYNLFCRPDFLVNNGSCIVVPCTKGGLAYLSYYVLPDQRDEPFPLVERHMHIGLSDPAFTAATDEERKLMFFGDNYRIKSFEWADPNTGQIHHTVRPTHTLASHDHDGPLVILKSGTILRAGVGEAAIWKLDGLPTHGTSANKRIGKKFKLDYHRNTHHVEYSAGSECIDKIIFADSKFTPAVWHPHPWLPATMLCATNPRESDDYSFVSLDLEHGGKSLVRYFGNGGGVGDFSTSKGDRNVFATAASDGHARVYDSRLPLPVLSIRAGTGREKCGAITLIHPDGQPALFTGSTECQVVRLWDLRARKMLYELSTGNNSVTGMTWDDSSDSLYVSTTSSYLGGDRHTYRRARLPESMLPEPVPPHGMPNYDDEGSFVKCWPIQASHEENYWGEVFNAGGHRIFRYAFKEDPDSISPVYGETTIREGNSYGW